MSISVVQNFILHLCVKIHTCVDLNTSPMQCIYNGLIRKCRDFFGKDNRRAMTAPWIWIRRQIRVFGSMNPFPACLALCLCLWIRTSASLLRVCSSNCYEFVHSFMRSTSPNVPDCPLAYYYQTHSSVNLLPIASSLWCRLCVSEIPFYKANALRSLNWILTRFRE